MILENGCPADNAWKQYMSQTIQTSWSDLTRIRVPWDLTILWVSLTPASFLGVIDLTALFFFLSMPCSIVTRGIDAARCPL